MLQIIFMTFINSWNFVENCNGISTPPPSPRLPLFNILAFFLFSPHKICVYCLEHKLNWNVGITSEGIAFCFVGGLRCLPSTPKALRSHMKMLIAFYEVVLVTFLLRFIPLHKASVLSDWFSGAPTQASRNSTTFAANSDTWTGNRSYVTERTLCTSLIYYSLFANKANVWVHAFQFAQATSVCTPASAQGSIEDMHKLKREAMSWFARKLP